MNSETFHYILQNPNRLLEEHVDDLKQIIDDYPYFQSARALYLKALKLSNSFKYNHNLKVTAAYTSDRSVLFDFITTKEFNQNSISENIKLNNLRLHDITVDFEDVSAKTKTDETEFLNHLTASKAVLNSDLFEEKSDKTLENNTTKQELSSIESIDNNSSSNEPKDAEAKLKIGSPLEFDKNETHSFSEWLSLSKAEPIKRITKNKVEETQGLPEKKPSRIERSIAKKNKLIEAFIAKNHKLEPKKNAENTVNLAKAQMIPREELMTETLARIYVEQKNYKKAIQSYNILSLKYPEKSGFFADQIKAVKQIQEKNNN